WRYRWRSTLVLCAAESKDRPKYKWQQDHADCKTNSFAKALGNVDVQNDRNDDVDEWDQHQEQPPARPTGDLTHHINVIDRNDRGPPWLPGFAENLPDCRNQQGDDREIANPENRTRTFGFGVIRCFLREEQIGCEKE